MREALPEGVQGVAIASLSRTTAGETSVYLGVASSLEAGGTPLSFDRSIEIPGYPYLFDGERPNSFFTLELPLINKYEAAPDGTVRRIGTLSVAGEGIGPTDYNQSFGVVVSTTKAFLFSDDAAKVVVFNPTDMTITRSFPIPIGNEDKRMYFTLNQGDRPGQIVFGAQFVDFDAETLSPVSYVIVVDTINDRIAGVTRDTRCSGLNMVSVADDGTVYLTPDVYTAALGRLYPDRIQDPCMLRVLPGEVVPDPSYAPSVKGLTGDSASAGIIPAGGDDAYLFSLDEAAAAITATSTAGEIHTRNIWRWSRVNLANPTTVVDTDVLGAVFYWWDIDGAKYSYRKAEGYEATFVRTDVAGSPQVGLTIPGVPLRAVSLK